MALSGPLQSITQRAAGDVFVLRLTHCTLWFIPLHLDLSLSLCPSVPFCPFHVYLIVALAHCSFHSCVLIHTHTHTPSDTDKGIHACTATSVTPFTDTMLSLVPYPNLNYHNSMSNPNAYSTLKPDLSRLFRWIICPKSSRHSFEGVQKSEDHPHFVKVPSFWWYKIQFSLHIAGLTKA